MCKPPQNLNSLNVNNNVNLNGMKKDRSRERRMIKPLPRSRHALFPPCSAWWCKPPQNLDSLNFDKNVKFKLYEKG